ncbi:major facilitator superfamily domain-containing protein [Gautieria morchelliformis]|nr:major facilitator superfamily domain-containing protein [Gautieria morchelliformis]
MSTERSPLLENGHAGALSRALTEPATKTPAVRLGPLEITAANRHSILVGIWMATFLSVPTLVATLVSSISSEYHRSNQASWLGTSFLLATCTFTPLYGRLSNVMGRRGANQTAVFFAGLGTLCCGLSTSLEMLIAARFLSGIGGGGIFTTATVITSDMYNLRDRSLAQGISSIFNGAGMGLGGPLGGYISDRYGWRWAFLIQIPLFVVSFMLTGYNLRYVTPGKGRSTVDVLKRIDYGGSFTLLTSMGSLLLFLSYKYNDGLPWNSASVIVTISLSVATFIVFILVEVLVAPEPVLAPFLLRKKVPMLIGISNLLVSMCNFAVMYFFPMFFETVMLTSSSTAGTHLLPNSISMSFGSLFAGWIMSSTGKYRLLDMVFGIGPFIATVLMTRLNEQSGIFAQWFSIIPSGFGNAVVLQTTLIALLVHVEHSEMAVATGFGQLWRGIGQVCGVAGASAIFQSILDRELSNRITGPGASDTIRRIRHSSRLVTSLPPGLQQHARDSYAIALRRVFVFSACSTLLAFCVRLAIPEKSLEEQEVPDVEQPKPRTSRGAIQSNSVGNGNGHPANGHPASVVSDDIEAPFTPASPRPISRRLSTYTDTDGGMDLEDELAGSARP